MPETMVFFLDRDAPGTREKLQGLIADGWVQDKSFNQGKAIELSSHVTRDLEVLAPVLVYHLLRLTPEEILAQAKKEEKAPISAFENVPAEKVNEYLKNGWEFMDEKNLVWQKNAHMVKRATKEQIETAKGVARALTIVGKVIQDAQATQIVTEPVVESPPGGGVEIPAVTKEMQITRESLELPFTVDADGQADLGDGFKVDANLAKLTLYPGKELTAEEKAFKEKHPKAFEIMQKRIDNLRKVKKLELFSPNAQTQSEDRKA